MPAAQGTDFLSAGEWAAFHGRPASGLTALHHALNDRGAAPAELAKARWLLGVCLGAGGGYGEAFEVLSPLATTPARGDRWASFAASTTGSLHRQLGRYRLARGFDQAALSAAEALPPTDVEPLVDALLGLAADAVGDGDVEAARLAWARAAEIADAPDSPWRPRVRAAWVSAEIALLVDDADAALSAAEDAVKGAEEARAPRHHAKSLVFRAVALRSLGDLAAAAVTARRGLALAVELGIPPVIWPAAVVLREVLEAAPEAALYPHEPARAADAARRAVGRIASGLPDDVAAGWLARPGVPDPYAAPDDDYTDPGNPDDAAPHPDPRA
jgi:tetratricopeptide (TPR) repeat protein